jgi:hypothetical protein
MVGWGNDEIEYNTQFLFNTNYDLSKSIIIFLHLLLMFRWDQIKHQYPNTQLGGNNSSIEGK